MSIFGRNLEPEEALVKEHEGTSMKSLEKENVSENISQLSGNSTESQFSQNMTTREAGVLATRSMSRNILGNLSSAHIRQFVSPFYRQFDLMPTAVCSKETQISGLYLAKAATQKIQSIKRQLIKKKLRKSSTEDSSMVEKRHKIDDIVARVGAPTQNYLLKFLKEKDSETNNRAKKSAIEYTKRVFQCELCKRRNME